jgi:hypothetical protein
LLANARRARDQARMARYDAIAARARPRRVWKASATALFRNWLSQIAAHKSAASRGGRKTQLITPAAVAL